MSVTEENLDFWTERLRQYPDERGVGHWKFPRSYNIRAYKVRVKALERLLHQYRIDLARKRIVDLGSGIGIYSRFFQAQGAIVTAVDFVDIPSLLPHYDSLENIAFVQADITRKDLNLGKRFDIATIFEVGLHLTDDAGYSNAIENVSRHVREGGWCLVVDKFPPLSRQPARHVRHRTRATWVETLQSYGFQILAIEPVIYLLYRTPLAFLPGHPDFIFEEALQRLRPVTSRASLQLLIARRLGSDSTEER